MFDKLLNNVLELPWFSDRSAILGIAITVVGFWFTLIGLARTKGASIAAREAVERSTKLLLTSNSIAKLSTIVEALEHQRELHRLQAWGGALSQYPRIRSWLVELQHDLRDMTDQQREQVLSAITDCQQFESELEAALGTRGQTPDQPTISNWNRILASHIDNLRLTAVMLRNSHQ